MVRTLHYCFPNFSLFYLFSLPLVRPLYFSGRSRLFAWLAVFLVSAVFHEVLVSVPLGMFRLYSLFAMLAQVTTHTPT